MNLDLCRILVCPDCQGKLLTEIQEGSDRSIDQGKLICSTCDRVYPIVRGIPRFVSQDQQYCQNFGWQWERFRRTQIDAFSGLQESENRFSAETGWPPDGLSGWLVLDAGCGAGRFASVASQWGAEVVAVDISSAVDACAQNMRELGHEVEVIQASLYRLPFRPGTFDGIFSLGVLQHTPDPKLAMRILPTFLKSGGRLALWIYEKRWTRFVMIRNLLRRITRRLPLKANYAFSVVAVYLLFPITAVLSRVPGLRKALPLIPISSRHYWGRLSLSEQLEWTILDTFDSYSAVHEYCQNESEVIRELRSAGLEDVHRSPARGMSIVGLKPCNPGGYKDSTTEFIASRLAS